MVGAERSICIRHLWVYIHYVGTKAHRCRLCTRPYYRTINIMFSPQAPLVRTLRAPKIGKRSHAAEHGIFWPSLNASTLSCVCVPQRRSQNAFVRHICRTTRMYWPKQIPQVPQTQRIQRTRSTCSLLQSYFAWMQQSPKSPSRSVLRT
jgi:hypothetical protein